MSDMSDQIDYGNLMHDAMRSLIRKVLSDVASGGLPGEHHFFINFDTHHEDVEIAEWMHDRFPDDMTIVLQHWFEDLDVRLDGFAVTLNFGDVPERLYVPFDAIRTFVDPSVEFGLRFELQEEHHPDLHLAGDEDLLAEEEQPVSDPEHDEVEAGFAEDVEEEHHDAEIVSLDSFRK